MNKLFIIYFQNIIIEKIQIYSFLLSKFYEILDYNIFNDHFHYFFDLNQTLLNLKYGSTSALFSSKKILPHKYCPKNIYAIYFNLTQLFNEVSNVYLHAFSGLVAKNFFISGF